MTLMARDLQLETFSMVTIAKWCAFEKIVVDFKRAAAQRNA